MTPYTPLLCLIACGLAFPVAAQTRADTTAHTECHNVGATVTCKNVAPVSAADAFRIFTASNTPYGADEPSPFVPPLGSTYIGRIDGDVFSDRWPFESAGIYDRLFTKRRAGHPRVVSPGTYRGVLDVLTGRWYR